MFTKTLATLSLLAGTSDALFSRNQYSANVLESCKSEVELLCSEHDEYPNTLTQMVDTEPEIRQVVDNNQFLRSVMNNDPMELNEDVMENMMISAVFFSDVVKSSENYYDEDSPEAMFDLMIVYMMDNSSEKEKLAEDMSTFGLKLLESSDEEEGSENGLRRRLASQLVEANEFPEIHLRKMVQKKGAEPEIKSGFPSLKFGAATDVCLWRNFNNGNLKDSDCITALNIIGEEVNTRIKRDSPESVLMLPVRTKSGENSIETTYLIFDRDAFQVMTFITMGLSMIAFFGAVYYTFFDSEEDENEDDQDTCGFVAGVLVFASCSILMWYEPVFSYFAFIPSLIVIGVHCFMDLSSRDEDADEEIETEKMLEQGFAYVAIPVQVV